MRRTLLSALSCLALAGCMSEDVLHYDGVSTAAGDAIAANSAMQMVDPWPAGVEETRLRTPLLRPAVTPSSASGNTSTAGN